MLANEGLLILITNSQDNEGVLDGTTSLTSYIRIGLVSEVLDTSSSPGIGFTKRFRNTFEQRYAGVTATLTANTRTNCVQHERDL